MVNASEDCTHCPTAACKSAPGAQAPPSTCPAVTHASTLEDVRQTYLADPALRRATMEAARTEAAGYCRDTRIEEIMAYARRLNVTHLGIAFCVGTRTEARLTQEIFAASGFAVSSVACKVGSIPKEEVGLTQDEKIHPGEFEALCNPLAQARLLAAAGTRLNVLIGLCVGHDSVFFEASEAPVTVLLAKDRVTGHNPAAVLYNSRSYYRRLRERSG